jgi:hypothetical protein
MITAPGFVVLYDKDVSFLLERQRGSDPRPDNETLGLALNSLPLEKEPYRVLFVR